MSINYEEEVIVSNDDLAEISALAKQQLVMEQRIKYHTEIIKQYTEDLRRLQMVELPAAMSRCGMSRFTLDNGVEVVVKKDVAASIAAKNKAAAFKWLKDNGHGSIVKTKEEIVFDRNDDVRRAQFESLIAGTEFEPLFKVSESVHAGTLKAFVRAELEEKGDLPEDVRKLLGVWEYMKAELKLPPDFSGV